MQFNRTSNLELLWEFIFISQTFKLREAFVKETIILKGLRHNKPKQKSYNKQWWKILYTSIKLTWL